MPSNKIKLYILAVTIGVLSLLSNIALASDISDAEYLTTVQVTNNGTALTNQSVVWTLLTSDMISNGMLSATADDLALLTGTGGSDIAVMPGWSTNPWVSFVSSIGENSNVNQYLYSKNVTGGKIVYFPSTLGANITDSASLEWSSNGSSTITGYFNTATAGHIASKLSAKEFVTGSNNVTVNIYNAAGGVLGSVSKAATAGNHTVSDSTDGSGLSVTVDGVTSTANISAQDLLYYSESDATNKITETATTVTGVTVLADADTFLSKNFGASHFNALDVRFEIRTENQAVNPFGQAGVGFAAVNNDVSGFGATDVSVLSNSAGAGAVSITLIRGNGVAQDSYAGGTSGTSYYCRMTRPAGNDTVTVRIYSDAAMTNLLDTLTVAGFGVAQWQYAYGFVNYNVGLANRQWDGFIRNFDIIASVPNTAGAWYFGTGGSMSYIESITMKVGGNTKGGAYNWAYGTTRTDDSGNGNTMNFNFRTTSSDADLSATIISQAGLLTASTPTSSNGSGWAVPWTAAQPDDLFTEGGDSYGIGGINIGALITQTANSAGQDEESWQFFFVFALAILAFAGLYALTHKSRVGVRGSMLVASIGSFGVLIYFYVQETIPGLALIPIGLILILLNVWRKSPSPVD